MLTKSELNKRDSLQETQSASVAAKEDKAIISRDKMVETAIRIYKDELVKPDSIDLGLHSESRAKLRKLCQTAVLEASKANRRRGSQSILSSSMASSRATENEGAISLLRSLQKERLIVSRMGFAERAMELDQEIEVMRSKAKIAREQEDNKILEQRMRLLKVSHQRKEVRLEVVLRAETEALEKLFEEELVKVRRRQEEEFLRVLESASRRAVGKAKRCNCLQPYLCRHNKIASYNTRRPTRQVVQYRRNGKRLKHAGRAEEGVMWEEKAREIDERNQERWRNRIALSIVASPWGANEAIVDQITETHKKELATLQKTHKFKRDQHEKRQATRRRNFLNTIMAEERKVRMQCRKQALLRVIRDFAEEVGEEQRQKKLGFQSDGLKNVSKNILGINFNDDERKNVDWVPPSTAGLENSVRLVDVFKAVDPNALDTRIMTKFSDIRSSGSRAAAVVPQTNSDDDSDSAENHSDDEFYKLGSTSGSKLMDKMKKKIGRAEAAEFEPVLAPLTTVQPLATNNLFMPFKPMEPSQFPFANSIGSNSLPGFTQGIGMQAGLGSTSWLQTNSFGGFPTNNAFSAPVAPAMPAPSNPSPRVIKIENVLSSKSATNQPNEPPQLPSFKDSSVIDHQSTLSMRPIIPKEQRIESKVDGSANSSNTNSLATSTSQSDSVAHLPSTLSSGLSALQLAEELTRQQQWSLDEHDLRPPKLKPGSVKDADWTEHEKSLGNGLYTSYPGVVIIQDEVPAQQSEVPSPDESVAVAVAVATDAPTLTTTKQSYQRFEPPAPGSAEAIPKKSSMSPGKSHYVSVPAPKPGPRTYDLPYRPLEPKPDNCRPKVVFGEDSVAIFYSEPPASELSVLIGESAGEDAPLAVDESDGEVLRMAIEKALKETNFTLPAKYSNIDGLPTSNQNSPTNAKASTQASKRTSEFKQSNATDTSVEDLVQQSNANPTNTPACQLLSFFSLANSGQQVQDKSPSINVDIASQQIFDANSQEINGNFCLEKTIQCKHSPAPAKTSTIALGSHCAFDSQPLTQLGDTSSQPQVSSAFQPNFSPFLSSTQHLSAMPSHTSDKNNSPPFLTDSTNQSGIANISNSSFPNPFPFHSTTMTLSASSALNQGGFAQSNVKLSSNENSQPYGSGMPFQPLAQNQVKNISISPRYDGFQFQQAVQSDSLDTSSLTVPQGSSRGGVYRPGRQLLPSSDAKNQENFERPYDWSITLFRWKCLENPTRALDKFLENPDIYEVMELFASSLGADGKPSDEIDESEEFDEDNLVGGKGSVLPILQLLHGLALYTADHSDREKLLAGLEEVAEIDLAEEGVDENSPDEDIDALLSAYRGEIEAMKNELSQVFVPELLLSEDFKIFYEESPAASQSLQLDSQAWLSKFQKSTAKSLFALHLYGASRGAQLQRPYANESMRKAFGPLCDSPSPREYIDSSTAEEAKNEILSAMNEGREAMVGVVCRGLRGEKPPSVICVKPLRAHSHGEVLYNLIIVLDVSSETSESQLKKLNYFIRCMP